MNKEQLVPSLELCKEASELGIKIDSVYRWIVQKHEKPVLDDKHTAILAKNVSIYPAPISTEELEIPDIIERDGLIYLLKIRKSVNHWKVGYQMRIDDTRWLFDADTENIGYINEHLLVSVVLEVLIWMKKKGF